jgi:hypothetical protein
MAGSLGFKSESTSDGYPEGLTIKNTLFYHFEKNLYIRDLYVGKFQGLYLDGGAAGCLDNVIENNTRTYFLDFYDTWSLKRGFIIGQEGLSAPKEYRIKFTNTVFDSLIKTGFLVNLWARELEFNNTTVYGDGTTQAIGIVTLGQNNFTKINNFRGRVMLSNVQIKGNGSFVELWNISNFDSLAAALHIYKEQTILVNGVSQ